MSSHRPPLTVDAELAGMVDSTGLVGAGQLNTGDLRPPAHVDISDGHLVWHENSDDPTAEGRRVVDPARALTEFVAVRTDADVESFARRFGALRLCKHGKPAGVVSRPEPRFAPAENFPDPEQTAGCCSPTYRESLAAWHTYVRKFRALVRTAATLRQGHLPSAQDWDDLIAARLGERDPRPPASRKQFATALARNRNAAFTYITQALNEVLQLTSLQPTLRWTPHQDSPTAEINGGIFGALAIQLIAAVSGASGLYVCDGCSDLYERNDRKPQPQRRNYCKTCREDGTAERVRKRSQRARRSKEAEA